MEEMVELKWANQHGVSIKFDGIKYQVRQELAMLKQFRIDALLAKCNSADYIVTLNDDQEVIGIHKKDGK